ncbi:MAG: methionine ABC transporter ATP-binding protein [Bacilli bacterium]
MIEVKNIHKQFGNFTALNDVSFNVSSGEILGIIGVSGAGKSTLIRIINQLEKQSSGKVFINGADISKLNKKELRIKRQEIAMIFQNFNLLWSRTVLENVELPLELSKVKKSIRKEKARKLLKLVGLEDKEFAYINELSGGQKQRVAIARALTNDPKLLLCDEATSALDPQTSNSILKLLAKINKELNLTIILITHQMEVVQKLCHSVAVINNGTIVEQGKVEDVFKQPKHQVTEELIQTLNNSEIATTKENLTKLYPNDELYRLTFTKNTGNNPILAQTILKHNILVNIIEANLSNSSANPMGILYIQIPKQDMNKFNYFIQDLKDNGLGVEKI